jgi:hypothetical protein
MSEVLQTITDDIIKTRVERVKLERMLKDIKLKEEHMIQQFNDIMASRGMKSVKRHDNVTLTTRITPTFYIKDKEAFLDKIKQESIGWKELVSENIHWSTLQANMKDLKDKADEEGGEYKDKYASLLDDLMYVEKKDITIRGLQSNG